MASKDKYNKWLLVWKQFLAQTSCNTIFRNVVDFVVPAPQILSGSLSLQEILLNNLTLIENNRIIKNSLNDFI